MKAVIMDGARHGRQHHKSRRHRRAAARPWPGSHGARVQGHFDRREVRHEAMDTMAVAGRRTRRGVRRGQLDRRGSPPRQLGAHHRGGLDSGGRGRRLGWRAPQPAPVPPPGRGWVIAQRDAEPGAQIADPAEPGAGPVGAGGGCRGRRSTRSKTSATPPLPLGIALPVLSAARPTTRGVGVACTCQVRCSRPPDRRCSACCKARRGM